MNEKEIASLKEIASETHCDEARMGLLECIKEIERLKKSNDEIESLYCKVGKERLEFSQKNEKLREVVKKCGEKFKEYCGRILFDVSTQEHLTGHRQIRDLCEEVLK